MATAPFTIEIDDRELRTWLEQVRATLAHPKPVLEDVARALYNATEDAIQAETSPFGAGWPARKAGGDWPLLQKSAGGLAASITHDADAASAWVGAGKEYAAIHQFGGLPGMAPGPAAIPERPYLPVDAGGTLAPATTAEVIEILRAALE
jgi:phage virion morphogenesis protein